MTETIRFDIDELTLGEMADIEDYTGHRLGEMFPQNGSVKLSGKELIAIVWIVKRRENPAFTLDDAKKLKFGELVLTGQTEDEGSAALDPTDAAS